MRLFFLCSLFLVLTTNLLAQPVYLRTTTIQPRASLNLEQIDENIPFLIQVKGPITNALKASITDTGLTILRYIPDNAFIVKGKNRLNLSDIFMDKNITFATEYRPEYKYLPLAKNETAMFTVIFFNGKTTHLEANNEILERLALNPEIEFLERYNIMVPMVIKLQARNNQKADGDYSDLDGSETGLQIIKAEEVYDALGLSGKGEIVGLADTGLDVGSTDNIHVDFQNAVKHGYNASLLSAVAPTQWNDPMGHGTHCAGSILGRGTASKGKIHGVAFNAQIVVASFWAPLINMMLVNPNFETTYNTAFQNGTMVHSNSWGGGQTPGAYDENARKFDQIAWDKPEMLLVFAAGNSGVDSNKDGKIDGGSVASPGTAKNVLTVGASENATKTGGIQVPISKLNNAAENWGAEPIFSDFISDNENGIAMFSSRGPTLDGRIKPDIVAPGTNILSNRSQVEGAEELWGAYNEDYVWSGGTSMATPITAGAAVLIHEYYKHEHKLNFIPAALVKATIINGAFDMYPGQYGTGAGQEILRPRPNNDEGWGRVDLENTLVQENGEELFFDNNPGLATGEEKEYQLNLNNPVRDLKITLVYSDFPGAAAAGRSLTNNLDLKVITPAGRTIYPNGQNSPDAKNNVEGIDIKNPQNGTYIVKVIGYSIPQGDNYGRQPFSIVATY